MMDGRSAPAGMPAPVVLLEMLTGKWISQAIGVAAQLDLATILGDDATPVETLAERAGAHAPSLRRLLRALASVGVFAEVADGVFANTVLSGTLREGIPGSMRSMAIFFADRPTWNAWGELVHSVRTGESGFLKAHGKLPFELMAEDVEAARHYDGAMTSFSAQEVEAIHRAFDFSGMETLVDVAGGHGLLLSSTLARHPKQRGVLFDRPHVLEGARATVEAAGVSGRCDLVAGDFFESVPTGGDGYVLKHILHDWKDTDAERILRSVRAAMKPEARLFVIDTVIDPGNDPSFAKLLDLEMLVLYDGGRERTPGDFVDLFTRAGLRLERIVRTESPACIVEAHPA